MSSPGLTGAGTSALLVGASGAVGRELVRQALANHSYQTLHLLLRHSLGYADHPVVREHIQPALDPMALELERVPDAVFCTLGTTRRQAGSKAAFYRVDHDLVLAVGRWAAARNVATLHVVSSMGADPHSLSHYLRTKGEAERDLLRLPLRSLYLYRPGLLDAPQRNEFRAGERASVHLLAGLRKLPLAWARRWQPMPVARLGACMLDYASQPEPGCHIVENAQLQLAAGD
jgi:uncharacterized protein YbjT (DUF2867 family)